MKRRAIFRITICLILGVVTTVAVAWIAACCARDLDYETRWTSGEVAAQNDVTQWSLATDLGCGSTSIMIRAFVQLNFPDSAFAAQRVSWLEMGVPAWAAEALLRDIAERRPGLLDFSIHSTEIEGYGWPTPALWCGWHHDGSWPDQLFTGIPTPLTIGLEHRRDNRVILPVRVIWRGLVINTLFYAALWFGVFFAAGCTRRFIRTRRGRCPRCGYDIQGNLADGCSECGWNRVVAGTSAVGWMSPVGRR